MTIRIRTILPQDATPIMRIAAAEPLFTTEEVDCVEELLRDHFGREDHNGYFFVTAEVEGRVAGFACYGPKALTQGTYDLYWIAVAHEYARRGLGRALMARVEADIRGLGGRLILVETSGEPAYSPTRAFYEGLGYTRAATIPEFYAPGDDLVIYIRRVDSSGTQAVG
jgi:ribosomal protein S18 acetylase RimI-like enzyme